jgi:hypothetical protein
MESLDTFRMQHAEEQSLNLRLSENPKFNLVTQVIRIATFFKTTFAVLLLDAERPTDIAISNRIY